MAAICSSVAIRAAHISASPPFNARTFVIAQFLDIGTASANFARALCQFLLILKRPRLHFFQELFCLCHHHIILADCSGARILKIEAVASAPRAARIARHTFSAITGMSMWRMP